MARILVADDRPMNRQYLVTLLNYFGHNVVEASDGGEALRLAKADLPSLVITDLVMPGMDGHQLAIQMLADPGLTKVPVIFYSATYNLSQAKSLAAEVGAFGVLPKPSAPEDILRTVNLALGLPEASAEGVSAPSETARFPKELADLEACADRLAGVIEMSLELASEADPHRLLQVLAHTARKLIGSKHTAVGLWSENSSAVWARFSSGMGDADGSGALVGRISAPRMSASPSSGSVLGRLIEERRPQRLRNVDAGDLGIEIPLWQTGQSLESVLAIPLLSSGILLGWILLLDKLGGDEFSIEDERVTSLLGSEAAVAYERLAERRKDEENLRDSKAMFENLFESAPDALLATDSEGRITQINAQAERMFGYGRAELAGQAIEILVPDRFREKHPGHRKAYCDKPLLRRMGVGLELYGRRKDGTEFPIDIMLNTMPASRGPLVLSVIRDVTERKLAEEQILNLNRRLEESAQEAGAANLAKSTFLSTMSHEIRTPLNAILGYAQLMARDPALGSDAKANLKIIGRSGEHLLALINDVLDMSKIEAGRIEIKLLSCNLYRVLDDLAAMFRSRAEAKGLRFQMLVDGESVPYVKADEGKIRQTLINLLGNAIKFTQRGHVKLHVTLDKRSLNQLWLSARIEDTGSGMTEEEQTKLFEPFHQTKRRLNTQEGTGLGLAISRQFARLMGGDITVSSSPGHGSIFRFEIPIEGGDAGVPLGRSEALHVIRLRDGTNVPRILVVDDQFENRDWLMKLLTSVGFSVRGAENGELAVRHWQGWNPDLILMDVHMPVMDGLEATRRIKEDPRGKETVIVVLTASALDDDRRTVAHSGADDFLAKLLPDDDLLEKLSALLDITYDYEELSENGDQPLNNGAALSADRLVRLPLQLVGELHAATLDGNKRRLDDLIRRVREAGDGGCAHALQELADKYEYDALTRLLDEACHR